MNIAVIGAGYVGLANALTLARKHNVMIMDIAQDRVELVRNGISPVQDEGIKKELANKGGIKAVDNYRDAVDRTNMVIIATSTNYDSVKNYFDTTSIESVLDAVLEFNANVNILIRSTIPVGYTLKLREKYGKENIYFAPEFLREGYALYDCLHPSRIIVGDRGADGRYISELLLDSVEDDNVPILLTGPTEAEAVKLFANTYLALRIAYFNELDSYSIARKLCTKEIIIGVCLDSRIGDYYNNPSFGYGGYCLPKDSKQLLANYEDVPQNLITAIVEANHTRKDFIVSEILRRNPKRVGIYRLVMKKNSGNFRSSAVLGIIERLCEKGVECYIYEPILSKKMFNGCKVIKDKEIFFKICDLIIANRWHGDLDMVRDKVYSCDVFERD